MTSRKQNSGFTLIELVVVIIILGILAVVALPKFINLGDDADKAVVKGTAGTFKEAVNLAHAAWIAKGANSQLMEDVEIYGKGYANSIDFNKFGWPAQHYDHPDTAGTHLDNPSDCYDLFKQIIQQPGPTISKEPNTEADYYVEHFGNSSEDGSCTYFYRKQPKYSFSYDSITGVVTTDFNTK